MFHLVVAAFGIAPVSLVGEVNFGASPHSAEVAREEEDEEDLATACNNDVNQHAVVCLILGHLTGFLNISDLSSKLFSTNSQINT